MASATRELKLVGYLNSELPTAKILVNGVEVYNGLIGEGTPGPTPNTEISDLAYFVFQGTTTVPQTASISVEVTSGSIGVGSIFTNVLLAPAEPVWVRQSPVVPGNDGRTNILIDGELPAWPSDGGPTVPGGTPENPDWTGWCFIVIEGSVLTFDYAVPGAGTELPPTV